MSTSTNVSEFKINILTKAQYQGIDTPSNTELYFVSDEPDQAVDFINLETISGSQELESNKWYSAVPNGNLTFVLPSTVSTIISNKILVQLNLSAVYTIDLGTSHYFGNTPDLSTAGIYDLVYEYNNIGSYWVVEVKKVN